jgi:hypothetical protein
MLRSFVRENRMQGSARGRSGNWPFYLDGQYKEEKLNDLYRENYNCMDHPSFCGHKPSWLSSKRLFLVTASK